ncbi:MAG TPA: DUF892 family protein [Flavisolibacter sp.]|jgi:ferritin-like metal-binding protein YciE|nr:DUF892 family protein [Flavisolibacter sp.]
MADTQGFYKGLRILWSAEKMLTEAMPGMIAKASHLGLKKNLAMHLAETDTHKSAIGLICKQLGIDPEGEPDQTLQGILENGQKAMSSASPGTALDEVIIQGAREVEKYEIESYTALSQLAEDLEYHPVAQRLRLTLEEERQADTKLRFLFKEGLHMEERVV